ncbi:hypothetical protein [Tortoise microvirus 56]|nr:hypothetical protein [Tortoise microvirus 56]
MKHLYPIIKLVILHIAVIVLAIAVRVTSRSSLSVSVTVSVTIKRIYLKVYRKLIERYATLSVLSMDQTLTVLTTMACSISQTSLPQTPLDNVICVRVGNCVIYETLTVRKSLRMRRLTLASMLRAILACRLYFKLPLRVRSFCPPAVLLSVCLMLTYLCCPTTSKIALLTILRYLRLNVMDSSLLTSHCLINSLDTFFRDRIARPAFYIMNFTQSCLSSLNSVE